MIRSMQNARPMIIAIATKDMKPASPSINLVLIVLWKLSGSASSTGAGAGSSAFFKPSFGLASAGAETVGAAGAEGSADRGQGGGSLH